MTGISEAHFAHDLGAEASPRQAICSFDQTQRPFLGTTAAAVEKGRTGRREQNARLQQGQPLERDAFGSNVIARSDRASKDARLSTGYGDAAIQEPQGALRSPGLLPPESKSPGVAMAALGRLEIIPL